MLKALAGQLRAGYKNIFLRWWPTKATALGVVVQDTNLDARNWNAVVQLKLGAATPLVQAQACLVSPPNVEA